MTSDLETDLLENVQNFMKSARLVYDSGEYTSATVIYFKALFSLFDLIIFKEKGAISKDHSDRFRKLEEIYPACYNWLDKNFEIYRNSYSTKIGKENCDVIKEYVEGIIAEQNI